VLSPGTERRRLAATVEGPARTSGYVTIGGEQEQGWLLAPVPHGAPFDPQLQGVVAAPRGTSLPIAALARFQLMAALGVARLPAVVDLGNAVVVGSGPVALGAALELRRRGAGQVRVLTSRQDAPIERGHGVECVKEVEAAGALLAIDAVGAPERTSALVAPGGVLGLIGTPEENGVVPALTLHRGGRTVVGMHELAGFDSGRYQALYTEVVTWLSAWLDPALAVFWCRTVPGDLAASVMESLGRSGRPNEPIILFSWET
jgi:threonine dehydrogenase-like Zn-dependent dehydrogenase